MCKSTQRVQLSSRYAGVSSAHGSSSRSAIVWKATGWMAGGRLVAMIAQKKKHRCWKSKTLVTRPSSFATYSVVCLPSRITIDFRRFLRVKMAK